MLNQTETAARAALDALPGLTWAPFEREDAPELNGLFAVTREHDRDPERWSEAELLEFWDAERSRPAEDVLLARDEGGRMVAVAWSGLNRAVTATRNAFLGGAVHPELRGRGIGRIVLAWELAHAAEWDRATREPGFGPLTMTAFCPVGQTDLRHLAERAGLPVVRFFHEMTAPLVDLPELRDAEGEPIAAVAPPIEEAPEGIRLLDWDPDRSDEVLALRNATFAEHWGSVEQTPGMWAEVTQGSTFRPAWCVLAEDETSGELVGFATGGAYEQDWEPQGFTEGYSDLVGVLPSHRGRGLASALLGEQQRRFAADGLQAAGLGVDTANTSNALRLYESLGYRSTSTTCAHRLELPEGAPPVA
ncbi:GNAT family N-acetyltransferase [Kytococcus sedentarius]|uniref:GNAT family N-acetyltransferase n=1 Tax=Kytococcus sedentarius TaxID=1276 RepID=UPI0035BBBF2B